MNTIQPLPYNRRGTIICLAIFALAWLAIIFRPHLALGETDVPIGPDSQANSAFNLDPFVVTIILSSIVPLVNGFLTSLTTSSKTKALLNLLMVTIVGVITVSTTDGGAAIISWDTIKSAALSFILAGSAYSHFYKPLDLTSSPVQKVSPTTGNLVTTPGKLASVGVTDKKAA